MIHQLNLSLGKLRNRKRIRKLEFEDYFKKMCGGQDDSSASSFKVGTTATSFNKKELRWLKDQLEDCITWDDPQKKSKHMYRSMLKKVEEQLEML